MKKNKKNIIIISCIVIVALVLVILLLINNKHNVSNEEKLILECSKSTEVNGFAMTLTKKMYTVGDEIKYVDGMHSNVNSEYLKGEALENYYEYQEASIMDKLNKSFGSDYKYVKLISEINGESATFDIEYIVNDESKEYITKVLNTNIFDLSIDEVLKQFEEVEFSCKSF